PDRVGILINCSFTDWPPWGFATNGAIWLLLQRQDPRLTSGTLTVAARDLAGHESAPTQLSLDIDCTPPPDAGTADAPPAPADAAAADAGAAKTTPTSSTGGCSLAGARSNAATPIALLVLAVARRMRRAQPLRKLSGSSA